MSVIDIPIIVAYLPKYSIVNIYADLDDQYMSKKYTGKTAVVTGSSSGIGAAIAKRYAEASANIVMNSRSYDRARLTATDQWRRWLTALSFSPQVTTT